MSDMGNKYYPLEEHLVKQCKHEVKLTFEEIENIICDKLPDSAYTHREWWANENKGSHVQAKAWINAGWKVEEVTLGKHVVFAKDSNISEPKNNREIKIGKRYRHFKGKEYLVLHVAKHSETVEDMVVYQALYGECGVWVRPLDMFMGQKEVDGKLINRFEEIVATVSRA